MSTLWGPAIDAELDYRRQQVRFQFRRSQHGRTARSTPRNAARPEARRAPTPLAVRAA